MPPDYGVYICVAGLYGAGPTRLVPVIARSRAQAREQAAVILRQHPRDVIAQGRSWPNESERRAIDYLLSEAA